jgi:hypothetical protein
MEDLGPTLAKPAGERLSGRTRHYDDVETFREGDELHDGIKVYWKDNPETASWPPALSDIRASSNVSRIHAYVEDLEGQEA